MIRILASNAETRLVKPFGKFSMNAVETYIPDRWLILKTKLENNVVYRVFASWFGGYTGSDSWRLNSGITHCKHEDNHYVFTGESGSIYRCRVGSYGAHSYGHSFLARIIKNSVDVEAEILPADTDWKNIEY